MLSEKKQSQAFLIFGHYILYRYLEGRRMQLLLAGNPPWTATSGVGFRRRNGVGFQRELGEEPPVILMRRLPV